MLRLSAAGISLVFFVIGLAMQVHAGKEYLSDVALVTLALASVIVSCK
jgi:Na+/proline symporter